MNPLWSSWGRFPRIKAAAVQIPAWHDQVAGLLHKALPGTILPRGLGRSYGDVCTHEGGTLLSTQSLHHILAFDDHAGVLRVEAGASFAEILPVIVPRGWFLPVSPGTKYVSVGGAVANDIHGKNHHGMGTFGCHVRAFELVRSTGETMLCSPSMHAEWFSSTIGGLGLTGCITWVELQLLRVPSPTMRVVYTPFVGIREFLALSEASSATYTVAWLDTAAARPRGIFMEGEHALSASDEVSIPSHPACTIPFDGPHWLVSAPIMKVFNTAYYWMQRLLPSVRESVSLNAFFYPLDAIGAWNRLYGKRGFLQYQFVVPMVKAEEVVEHVLSTLRSAGLLSFLTVIKVFGEKLSPGWLSFPSSGVTLALDIPYSVEALAILERLDATILAAGGRLYPAKDARMSAATFQAMYPHWRDLENKRDPAILSGFWKRVTSLV